MRHPPDERTQPLTAVAGQGQHDVAARGAGIDAGPVDRHRVLVRLRRLIEEVQPAARASCHAASGRHADRSRRGP